MNSLIEALPIYCAIFNLALTIFMAFFSRPYPWFRSYFLFMTWIILWMATQGGGQWVSPEFASWVPKFELTLGILAAVAAYHLSLNIAEQFTRQRYILFFLYAQVVVLMGWMNTSDLPQTSSVFFLFLLLGFFLAGFQILYYQLVSKEPKKKRWAFCRSKSDI